MPITAKLSNRFYQQFGDDTTNELVEWLNSVDATSQLQLRELNELNFARFRAEMQARFAEQDTKFEHRFAELRTDFTTSMARLETRLAWQLMGTLATFIGVLVTLGGLLLRR